MRTLIISRNCPPTVCGIGDHSFRLAQELVKRGGEAHIACHADQSPGASAAGVSFHPIIKDWGKTGAATIEQLASELRPDWAVVQYAPHSFHPKGLPFGILFFYKRLARLGVPVLTVFHEVRIRPWGGAKNWAVSNLQMWLANRLAFLSKKVVTSIDIYAAYLRRWRERLVLIPVGSNIAPVEPGADDSQKLRERLGIAAGAPVVATFGNRDVSPFLAAFDGLADQLPDLVWLICGRNPTPPGVLAGRRYLLPVGELPAEEVYRHLALADVFFTPDLVGRPRGDGGTCNKSGSLACGMSLGIPVVGARGDMNNALLRHGENILLVDILDKEELSAALRECLLSKEKAASLGRAARKLYDEELDWPVVAGRFAAAMAPQQN